MRAVDLRQRTGATARAATSGAIRWGNGATTASWRNGGGAWGNFGGGTVELLIGSTGWPICRWWLSTHRPANSKKRAVASRAAHDQLGVEQPATSLQGLRSTSASAAGATAATSSGGTRHPRLQRNQRLPLRHPDPHASAVGALSPDATHTQSIGQDGYPLMRSIADQPDPLPDDPSSQMGSILRMAISPPSDRTAALGELHLRSLKTATAASTSAISRICRWWSPPTPSSSVG